MSGDDFETEACDLDLMIVLAKDAVRGVRPMLWDPFVAEGSFSQQYIAQKELYAHGIDWDTTDLETIRASVDCIVTNPPFSYKAKLLKELVEDLGVPFVLLLPTATLQRKFMRRFLTQGVWEIHIPDRFLWFHRQGTTCPSPPFPSAFFVWRPTDDGYNKVSLYYFNHERKRN